MPKSLVPCRRHKQAHDLAATLYAKWQARRVIDSEERSIREFVERYRYSLQTQQRHEVMVLWSGRTAEGWEATLCTSWPLGVRKIRRINVSRLMKEAISA